MSLLSAAERLAAMDRSAVKFSVERCLHTQDRYSSCTACFDICPAEAIQPGKPPALLSDTCRNCLVCLAMCPMGAYQADDGISALLTCVTRTDTKIIELVCEKHSNAEMGKEDGIAIRIKGCLAGLGSGTYLMLAALGVEQIIVRLDECENCEWAGLREQVEKQAVQARQLLSMWGKAKNVVCWSEKPMVLQRPLWEAANPPLSRRDLFRMAAQQGKIAMARAMENKNINAQKGMGNNRRRMLAPSNIWLHHLMSILCRCKIWVLPIFRFQICVQLAERVRMPAPHKPCPLKPLMIIPIMNYLFSQEIVLDVRLASMSVHLQPYRLIITRISSRYSVIPCRI